MTTRALEQEVRASDPRSDAEDLDDALPSQRVRVRCTPAVCEKWAHVRELAERVAGQRLRGGEALELVAAEAFSALSIAPAFAEMANEPPVARRGGALDPRHHAKVCPARARTEGLPESIAALAAGLDGTDAFELDRRLRRAVALEQTLDAAMAPLLRCDRAFQRCLLHPERAQDPIPPVEQQLCARDVDTEATQELAWRVPRAVAWLFVAVQETLCAKLRSRFGRPVTAGEAFEALLDGAILAWTLRDPRARRPDPVIERDDYRCAVPGCTSRRNLHDHHVVFRSAGGSDAPENRATLCAFHHQRALHAGLMRVHGRAPAELVFELGVRPGAEPLVRYRSGDIAVAQ